MNFFFFFYIKISQTENSILCRYKSYCLYFYYTSNAVLLVQLKFYVQGLYTRESLTLGSLHLWIKSQKHAWYLLYKFFFFFFFFLGGGGWGLIPCNTYKIFMSDLICCWFLCIHTANMTKVTKYHLIPMMQKNELLLVKSAWRGP